METRTITVYNISELSEDAIDNAYNAYCQDDNYFWSSENEETLKAFCAIFPVNAKDWEYGYRAYVNYEFAEEPELADLSGIRLLKYLVNNYWHDLYSPEYRGNIENSTVKHKRVKHKDLSNGKTFSSYNSGVFFTFGGLTGFHMDYAILKPIADFMKKPDGTTFQQLLYECLQEWVFACQKDYEYAYSKEAFMENSESNKWTYDENGNLI